MAGRAVANIGDAQKADPGHAEAKPRGHIGKPVRTEIQPRQCDQPNQKSKKARDGGPEHRARLEEGDFRAGDRITISLDGEPELLPDTLLVERGAVLSLPNMGEISVYGILRSELEDHLRVEIGRFLREPNLTVQSLVRLSVQGSVGRPGFYVFPAEMLLQDVLMAAGGPAQSSKLDAISIRRGEETLMRGGEVQLALDEGRSLDQLGLRAGDELNVPLRATSNWRGTVLRWGAIIIFTTFLGVRIY